MELRRDLLVGIGALVAFNVLLSFGVVGLLVRMSPAIERIMQENVYSIEAAEEMMATLAAAEGHSLGYAQRQRFESALARTEGNITDPREKAITARIRQRWPDLLMGDMAARATLVAALQDLITINRAVMHEVDREAQRMGTAGAWAAVFASFLGFLLSIAVIRRLRRRILSPLTEVYGTLEAARMGDPYRRCTSVDAPIEIKRIARAVNLLLDRQQVNESDRQETERVLGVERLVLLHLLEERPEPTFVVDERGQIAAMNKRAVARLGATDGPVLRRALAAVPTPRRRVSEVAADIETTALDEGKAWLCTVGASARRARTPGKRRR